MKRAAVFFAIILPAIVFISGNALAIRDDTPNMVGLYWNPPVYGEPNTADIYEAPYAPYMTGQIIITNPTFDTFSGVELALHAWSDGLELPMDGIYGAAPNTMGSVVVTGGFPLCAYETAVPIVTNQIFGVLNVTLMMTVQGLDPRYTYDSVEFHIEPVPDPVIPGAVVALPAPEEPLVELALPFGSLVAMLNGGGYIWQPPPRIPFSTSFDSDVSWWDQTGCGDFTIADGQLNWNADRSVDQKYTVSLAQNTIFGYSGNFLIEFDFQLASKDNDIWLEVGMAESLTGSFDRPATYPVGPCVKFGWQDDGTPDGAFYVHPLARYADEMPYDGGFSATDPLTYIAYTEDAWYHARMEVFEPDWRITILDEMQSEVGQMTGSFPKEFDLYTYIYIANPDDQGVGVGSGFIDNLSVTRDDMYLWQDIASSNFSSSDGASVAAAWGDFDQDGDDDLYVVQQNSAQPNILYVNNGSGGFEEGTPPLLADAGAGTDASWGDYDNDGDLDLFVSNFGGANRLFQNDGSGESSWQFSEVLAGDISGTAESVASAWVDYDHDGQLEIYVSNRDGSNQLLGLQHNWANTIPDDLDYTGPSQGFGWCDYDLDMKPDLYLVDEKSLHQLFVQSSDGSFDIEDVDSPISGQGCSWGDFDNDGDFDIFLTYWAQPSRLLENLGNDQFSDVTCQASDHLILGQGAAWGDYDNDGFLDLYVATYGGANELYHNVNGTGQFDLVDKLRFNEPTQSIGTAWSDMDNDGDLDLYVCNDGAMDNLYRNNVKNENRWLKVKLEGAASGYQSNSMGMGAIIVVETGDLTMMRSVSGGTGYAGQSSLIQHFGLGATNTVDRVTVYWPFEQADGSYKTSILNTVYLNTTNTIVEPPQVSGVDEPGNLPSAISLHACYPNPFNPKTTITYNLPKAAKVTLNIYDISGRRVKTLIAAESKAPGSHEVIWNGRNRADQTVAAGVYFYKLDTGGFSKTRRMTLVK